VANYETIQRRRNIVVGIFVIVGLSALGWLIYKFGELPSVVSRIGSFQVFVQFPNASGAQEDTPVHFCGYQIGRVVKIMKPMKRYDKVSGLTYYQTVAVLSIDDRYTDIPSNVVPKLMSRGLGSSYIDFKYDPQKEPTALDPNVPESIYLYDKAVLQGATGMTSEFFPEESQKKFEELIGKISLLIDNTNEVIGSSENQKNVRTVLSNLSEATSEATETLKEFGRLSQTGTTTLSNADEWIDQVASSLVQTSDELCKTVSEIRLVLEKVNRGEGSASRFLNNGKFYENLLENSQQLENLLEEIQSFVEKSRDKGLPLKLK